MLSEKKLSFALFAPIATGIIGLLTFAWQGTFARLLADDYYHYYLLHSHANLFQSIVEKYTYANNRYTTLFFFQLSEWIGVQWMPALMIVIWVFSMYWLLRSFFVYDQVDVVNTPPSNSPREREELVARSRDLSLPRLRGRLGGGIDGIALASAVLIAFFSILQAPNRYQSIYWISSSVTHFFPLPLYTLLLAWTFDFVQNKNLTGFRSLLGFAIPTFILSYFIGGLSESSAALNFTVMVVIGFFLWVAGKRKAPPPNLPRETGEEPFSPRKRGELEGGKSKKRHLYLFLALSALANIAALLTMALSPANAMRTDGTPLPFTDFILRLLTYPGEFMLNTFKTLPLPTLATFALGFLVFGIALEKRPKPKSLITCLLITPFLTYLFIAASFAPNAYVFSYPDDRVLFPAQFLLTAALFAEGALAGMLFTLKKLQPLAALLLIVVAFYPLRGAWNTVEASQTFIDHAQAWDTRDAYIRSQIEAGETDIIVPTVNGVAGIKELDISARHWVNQGAAAYYGVKTISVDTTRYDYDQ